MASVRRSATLAPEPWSTARTSLGVVRRTNEDRYIERGDIGLWAVADGMGGHECGEIAASLAVEALARLPRFTSGYGLLTAVRDGLDQVNTGLVAQAAAMGAGVIVGATIVVLVVFDDHFACVWAGDSRVYRIRGGRLEQITRDHSVARELIEAHAITEAEALAYPGARRLTRALGASDDLDLEVSYGALEPGDAFLLCSDGLTGALSDIDLEHLSDGRSLQTAADDMLALALARGARDNVTLILVRP